SDDFRRSKSLSVNFQAEFEDKRVRSLVCETGAIVVNPRHVHRADQTHCVDASVVSVGRRLSFKVDDSTPVRIKTGERLPKLAIRILGHGSDSNGLPGLETADLFNEALIRHPISRLPDESLFP